MTHRSQIHTDIESQFPALYRESGETFVEFIDYYYEYVDQLENNFRNSFTIRDIDTTFEDFLKFFQMKYMDGLPSERLSPDEIRYITKHINDLYQRKGTEDGLKLFFRIFFQEDVEVWYPAQNILRASDSVYASKNYLEMDEVYSVRDYSISRGDKLTGTVSDANATVDRILFKSESGAITPIIYLSDINGEFNSDDGLYIERIEYVDNILTTTTTRISESIKGSINGLTLLSENRIGGNSIGDIVSIESSLSGKGGRGIVTEVSKELVGGIDFDIEDGGFGFTVANTSNEQTEVIISNQVLVLDGDELANTPSVLSVVSASNSAVYDSDSNTVLAETLSGSGILVKYEHPTLYIKSEANTAFNPIQSNAVSTIDIAGSGIATVRAVSIYPESVPNFEIASLVDTETIKLVMDRIADYANVALDAADYGMPGGVINANSMLYEAFVPEEFEIGTIDKILVVDSGIGMSSQARSYIKQEEVAGYKKKEFGVIFTSPTFIIGKEEIVTQQYTKELYNANNVPVDTTYTAKAKFNYREGDVYYFKPISLYGFKEDLGITIRNTVYEVENIFEVLSTNPIGMNSIITGTLSSEIGRIDAIKIIDTGYNYQDEENVSIINVASGETVATASLTTRGIGYGEGEWITTSSFLSENSKVLQDNHYYQEFSYDIASSIKEEDYVDSLYNTVHVAGTKHFSSYLINSSNKIGLEVDVVIELVYEQDAEFGLGFDTSFASAGDFATLDTIYTSLE